jgi:hypothetical protein
MTEKNQNNWGKAILHIITPVFIGLIIYGLFRRIPFIDPEEKIFPLLNLKIYAWVKFNLPDGLWFYSLLSVLAIIWHDSYPKYFFAWSSFIILSVYFTEFLQAKRLIPGTFDWADLAAYTVALIAHTLNFKFFINQFTKIKKLKKWELKKIFILR